MKTLVLKFIRLYQYFPTTSHFSCRFIPTCSEYTYQAIEKYGIFRGGLLGIKRILACHPFSRRKVDFVV